MESGKRKNYIHIRRFSVMNAYYLYMDTAENLADELFIRKRIPVSVKRDYCKPGNPFKFVYCRVPKTHEREFLDTMAELRNKCILFGYAGYDGMLDEMSELFHAKKRKKRDETDG